MTEITWSHFIGRTYRAHNPRWASDPLSGEGAARPGGRFNRKGTPALYSSLDPMTAWSEAQQAFVFKPQPMTLVAYEVDCTRVADLTHSETLSTLGFTAEDLACAWEDLANRDHTPPTWLLADHLITEGAHGALALSQAPGTRPDATNLVLWDWHSECPVEVIDDFGRLPADR